jgi:hypothetical protein
MGINNTSLVACTLRLFLYSSKEQDFADAFPSTPAPIPVLAEDPAMLSYHLSCCRTAHWARENFRAAHLGDSRRSMRAQTIAEGFAARPGHSIPALFDSPYDIKAAYGFFARPEATSDNIQAGHRDLTRKQISKPGQTILLIEDTSELTWPGNEPIEGLGPIGSGKKGLQGFLLHSSLAARWSQARLENKSASRPPVEVLGLAEQIYHVRKPRPKGEARGDKRARQMRSRESQLWEQISDRLGPAPERARWERVCDRGADIYEFLVSCRKLDHGFVVRSGQNRCLEDPQTGRKGGYLFETARGAPILGHFELSLRSRPGQKARKARLALSAVEVIIRSPLRPGRMWGALPGVPCTVVRVFEDHPPQGVKKPLEWILLYDRPVETFEQAMDVTLKYSTRWLIEEFHKALKTGLGAERLQLTKASRLFAAIAIMSVTALRLIDLREMARRRPLAAAEQSGLTRLELDVLSAYLKRNIKTVKDVALAVGRLGGHMNRKADAMPGWKTLWLGMKKLHDLVQGVKLAKNLSGFG